MIVFPSFKFYSHVFKLDNKGDLELTFANGTKNVELLWFLDGGWIATHNGVAFK